MNEESLFQTTTTTTTTTTDGANLEANQDFFTFSLPTVFLKVRTNEVGFLIVSCRRALDVSNAFRRHRRLFATDVEAAIC